MFLQPKECAYKSLKGMFTWRVDNIENGKSPWPQHNKTRLKTLRSQQAACWGQHICHARGSLFWVFYKSSKFTVSLPYQK